MRAWNYFCETGWLQLQRMVLGSIGTLMVSELQGVFFFFFFFLKN